MSVGALVESIATVDAASADQTVVERFLSDIRRVRGWLDSCEVAAARRLEELASVSPSMFPERVVADQSRVSLGEASKGFERARTVNAVPELGVVLHAGDTSAAHVDVVTRALRELNNDQRNRLAARGEVLALAAAQLPRDEFARAVRGEVRRVCADDGVARLQRQRHATRLNTWVDRETGMWCMRGEFDPETGAMLDGRLRNTVEALFHDRQPDTCPADPLLKQAHLRALALVALTGGRGSGRGRIDVSILIDAHTLANGEHDASVIDCGLPIDLPVETLRRMTCCAEAIVPVIVAADGASLYLGRETRLANRPQRRALRVMYRGCAVPRCSVAFDRCKIHHLHWFRHGGRTDIDNLLPLCDQHHHLAHEGGWQLTLDPHRNLTITYPDGKVMTTGPPQIRAG